MDIRAKIIALRVSWLKRLYTGTDHAWKKIPTFLLNRKYPQGAFFPNVILQAPKHLPAFYQNIMKQWMDLAATEPLVASVIQNQIIWNNRFIKIGNMTVKKVNTDFGFNFISDFYNHLGQIMPWEDFKRTYNVSNAFQFKWRQIVHAIPTKWKTIINNNLRDFLV